MSSPPRAVRFLSTSTIIIIAVIACALLYLRHSRKPWTRDAQVTADIIMMAPRVTGLVINVPVVDNQHVEAGALIFEIDPRDYEIEVASARTQLDQARQQAMALEAAIVAAEAGVTEAEAGVTTAAAQIDAARAQVASAQSSVSGAEAGLKSAQASIDKAKAGLDQEISERDRAQRLEADGAGSKETAESKVAAALKAKASLEEARAGLLEAQATVEQATSTLAQAEAGLASAEASRGEAQARLASARAQLAEARANLGEPGELNVQVRAAKVSLERAELDLSRTTVRAPTRGYVTNLNVDIGDYASAGAPLLAFVDSGSFHVQGFFRETQLRHIAIGDRAVITLMGHRDKPIEGVVESIGWAINPPNIATTEGSSGLVPQVQPSFDWIRLAQRVPVRVRIESVPDGIELISGTTASVAIKSDE